MPTKYKAKYTGHIYDNKESAVKDNISYLKAKRLSLKTTKIPITYIGGTPDEARTKFWQQEPVLQHAIDSVSNLYGVDADMVKNKINHEGFVDHYIQDRNNAVLEGRSNKLPRGYAILNDLVGVKTGISDFGFDDYGTYLDEGKIKLKGKRWYFNPDGTERYVKQGYYTDYEYTNENGRKTNPATGYDNADNFGMTAAGLKYFRDIAKADNPNASDYDLNRYAQAYFNRGVAGGRKWVKSGAKGYDYKRRLESQGKKSK